MNVPRHIAIIMDGNGRWAEKRKMPRIYGHKAGVKATRRAIKSAIDLGIEYLTLYTFSHENWSRPKKEVDALMKLLQDVIRNETKELMDYNVKVRFIGNIEELPASVKEEVDKLTEKTKENTGLTLLIALNYGGRREIMDAVNKIIQHRKEPLKYENDFRSYLYAPDVPDPDLLIRTSGEVRVSNFLLWEIAYTEIWITKTLWPNFKKTHIIKAIQEYNQRERKFGGIG